MDFCAPCWFITFNSPGVGLGNVFLGAHFTNHQIKQVWNCCRFLCDLRVFSITCNKAYFHPLFQGRGFSSKKRDPEQKKDPKSKQNGMFCRSFCCVAWPSSLGAPWFTNQRFGKKLQIWVVFSRLKFPLQNKQDWYMRGWVHNQTLRQGRNFHPEVALSRCSRRCGDRWLMFPQEKIWVGYDVAYHPCKVSVWPSPKMASEGLFRDPLTKSDTILVVAVTGRGPHSMYDIFSNIGAYSSWYMQVNMHVPRILNFNSSVFNLSTTGKEV